jgi:outer membrane protein
MSAAHPIGGGTRVILPLAQRLYVSDWIYGRAIYRIPRTRAPTSTFVPRRRQFVHSHFVSTLRLIVFFASLGVALCRFVAALVAKLTNKMDAGMKKLWFAAVISFAIGNLLATPRTQADVLSDEGPWLVRLRGVYLDMADKSDAIPSLGVPSNAIHVNSKALPDLDIEYYFTPHWSSELVLTYPQSQTVSVEKSALGGPTLLGSFKHLPPVLTAKYNFTPDAAFRPYVGLGLNLTIIWDANLAVPTSPAIPLNLDSTSIGVAGQAGFDIKLADRWFANADVKWVQLGSDVKSGGSTVSKVHLDPWLFGLGIGYRFGGSGASGSQ